LERNIRKGDISWINSMTWVFEKDFKSLLQKYPS
jgi:hypothetical protein